MTVIYIDDRLRRIYRLANFGRPGRTVLVGPRVAFEDAWAYNVVRAYNPMMFET